MKTNRIFSYSIAIFLLLISPITISATAQTSPRVTIETVEGPNELTQQEFQNQVSELYSRHPEFELVVDLKDSEGIDPDLLPPDIAAIVDKNTKVVAYKEMELPEKIGKVPGLASIIQHICLSIGCASPNGSRDVTVSNWYDGVKQYSRAYGLRYDHYSGCDYYQNCRGWEVEQQWAKWEREDYSWSVYSARVKTYIYGENYCTENSATLNHASTYFTPTFYGLSTNWWTISGFANNAYVPLTAYAGWSRTRSDIYEDGLLQFNDAYTTQYWPRNYP